MSKKEVFDQNLGDILEFDSGLDINSILDSVPAIDDVKDTKPDKVDDAADDKVDFSNDINKVFDSITKDSNDKDDVVDDTSTDDLASVSNDTKKTDDTSDASFTVIFAKDLVEQGLISSFKEDEFLQKSKEVGEATALRELIQTEINSNLEAAKQDLEEGYKQYLSFRNKGVDADTAIGLIDLKEKFDQIKVEDLEKEDNSELRKQLMSEYFRLTTSMTDKKIEKLVQTSVDLGDDIDDSKEYLTTLQTLVKDKIKEEETAAENKQKLLEDENKRMLSTLKDNINSLNEIIAGIPVNTQVKKQMYEAITKPIKDNKGRVTNAIWALRSEDPMFFDERLAYLFATGYFTKDKVWDKLSAVKTTKVISELEKAIDSKRNTSTTSGGHVMKNSNIDPTTKSNIDAMRNIFGR